MKYKRIIILLFTIIFINYFIKTHNFYSLSKERSYFATTKHKDDTLRIAYYGDSWAEMHKNHSCEIIQLINNQTNKPVKLSSHGLSGMTSKEIYEYMFQNKETHDFIRQGYDYILISAGINDCNNKTDVNYYKKNMTYIINFMIKNHIYPMILEIPDYNIFKAYENQDIKKKLISQISIITNGTKIDCKQQFRDALDELINEKGYNDKISVIRYKSWNNDYENDLNILYLNDGMHLNEKGYLVLDSMIAKTISHHYASKHGLSHDSLR